MKKLMMYLLLSCVFFLGIDKVRANDITEIKMDIYIDSKGNAHITESWDASLTEGTEGYRFYGNMGNSTIEDFHVKDETKTYTDIGSWDVHSSFNEKAYKSGIHDTGSTKELCFGISQYGTHTYTLTYTITGFVAEIEDAQIAYWELIPTDLAKLTNRVYIRIYADKKFQDDLAVWGYGNYGGYAYVYDGYIEASNDSLDSDEYMTLLIRFDKGTFQTSNVLEHNFDHYYQMAEEGAEHYKEENSTSLFEKAFFLFQTILIFIVVMVLVSVSLKKVGPKSGTKTLSFGSTGKKISKDIPMFRDIPCNKDLYRAYWVAYNYDLMKNQTDFLGAILLKWLSQNHIKIESKTVGRVFKKEDTTIIFQEEIPSLDTDLEKNLYEYMYEASKDGVLESKEFERWCQNHYDTILNWFDHILDDQNQKLLEEGKLTKRENVTFKIFKSVVYEVDPSMLEEAKQMKGLKKFFLEFENMEDKEAIEVKFWQEYLMYAQLFGVAKKVAKQFKKLYPELISDYSYDSIIFVHTISYSGMSSARSARSRAQSYSSGGGGFSSGGGGGGSFGGGGGGGFR